MRTLSKQTQYCLKALYVMSRAYPRRLVLIDEMCEEESIPRKFLEQILLKLKAQKLVESKTGKGGGYGLCRKPSQITVGQVIRMIEGPLAPLPCASVTAYRKCDECPDDRTCGTRIIMAEVRDAIAKILDSVTLADVCRRIEEAKGELAGQPQELMYYI